MASERGNSNRDSADKSLEEILQLSKEIYNLDVNNENYDTYKSFLESQLKEHPEYNLDYIKQKGGRGKGATKHPFKNLLLDKLLLFSYLIGETTIVIDSNGRKKRIGRFKNGKIKPVEERSEDLSLLSQKLIGACQYEENRSDVQLYRLFHRQLNRKNLPTFEDIYENWESIIDELAQYEEVKNFFGRIISYRGDVYQKGKISWPRVQLTEEIREEIRKKKKGKTWKELKEGYGLSFNPGTLMKYTKSISFEDYKKILGKKPAIRPERANAEFSRKMGGLLFYRYGMGKEEFYKELANEFNINKYNISRIFRGVATHVDARLEDYLKTKLFNLGLESELEIKSAIEELEKERSDVEEKRYSYSAFKEVYEYLKENLGVGYEPLLGRNLVYYKASDSRTISEENYQYLLKLRERTEQALNFGSFEDLIKIREEIYGRDTDGRVHWITAKPFLECLKMFGFSTTKLLGRSKYYYEKSQAPTTISRKRYDKIVKLFNEQISSFFDGRKEKKSLVSRNLLSILEIKEDGQKEALIHYDTEIDREYNNGMVIYHHGLNDIGIILRKRDRSMDVYFKRGGMRKLAVDQNDRR